MSADEPSETHEEPALLPPPPHVGELAVACIGYVQRSLGVELDFTPETLPLLDHWLQQARTEVRGLDLDKREEPLIDAVVAPAGAYVGEVARRLLGGRWFCPPGEYRRWRIELTNVFLSFNPIGLALETVLGKEAEGSNAFFRVHPNERAIAERAVANLPEVPEEEYYAPSSRLEVLQIVADALAASHPEPRTYSESDYGDVRTEAIGAALPVGHDPIEA